VTKEREQELLQKARLDPSDHSAFEELLHSLEKLIRSRARALLWQYPDEVQPAFQEVSRRIFSSLSKFKGKSRLSTYVYRITTNVCVDILRLRSKESTLSLNEPLIENEVSRYSSFFADANDTKILQREIIDRVMKEFEADDPMEAKAVIRSVFQGYSRGETALLVGLSIGRIKDIKEKFFCRCRKIFEEIRKTPPVAEESPPKL
jgi:RNA polymerase sigma-70 factor (ECF subfamily)